jgi:hypothetical protein
MQLARQLDSDIQKGGPHVKYAQQLDGVRFEIQQVPAEVTPPARVVMPVVFGPGVPTNRLVHAESLARIAQVEITAGKTIVTYMAPPVPFTFKDEMKVTVFIPGYALTTKTYHINVKPSGGQKLYPETGQK